jgi:hypothetical protein
MEIAGIMYGGNMGHLSICRTSFFFTGTNTTFAYQQLPHSELLHKASKLALLKAVMAHKVVTS